MCIYGASKPMSEESYQSMKIGQGRLEQAVGALEVAVKDTNFRNGETVATLVAAYSQLEQDDRILIGQLEDNLALLQLFPTREELLPVLDQLVQVYERLGDRLKHEAEFIVPNTGDLEHNLKTYESLPALTKRRYETLYETMQSASSIGKYYAQLFDDLVSNRKEAGMCTTPPQELGLELPPQQEYRLVESLMEKAPQPSTQEPFPELDLTIDDFNPKDLE